jgi:hypothetical protein
LLSTYSVQNGIKEYKKRIETKNEFKSTELSFFNDIRNYNQYSYLGFKILFIPGMSSIFFSNPVFLSELSARINSVTCLDIGSNCKGGAIFKGNSPFAPRFSNVVRVLASLLILFLGFEIMRKREFLRSLSSQWSKFGVFITTGFSLALLFILCILVIFACCIGLTVLQGISLTPPDIKGLVIDLPPMINKLLFFFFVGTLLGNMRSKYTGFSGLLAVWTIFIFIYPAVVDSYIEEKSHDITSAYKADKEKLKTMSDFERRAVKESGEFKDNTVEGRRKVIEDFWENERKQIEAVDEKLKQEISQLIDQYNTLSLFTPTTFYTYTCNEVSSRGYQSYLDFYTYLQDLRRKFVRFWLDRVYYHDPKVLVNFVTNDENLFFSKSQVPANELEDVLNNEALKKILHHPIKELEKHEKFEVSLGHLNLCQSDIYMINNIASGLPLSCSVKLLDKMEELQANSLVIFLITPEEVDLDSLPEGVYFQEDDIWINRIKSMQRVIEMSKKGK